MQTEKGLSLIGLWTELDQLRRTQYLGSHTVLEWRIIWQRAYLATAAINHGADSHAAIVGHARVPI